MAPAEAESPRTLKQTVEVVYALPETQSVVRLPLPPEGMTAGEAIHASGLRSKYPEIDRADLAIGVFGKPCELARVLQPGDRVEIYRPLRNDPRAMRRARAAQGTGQGTGQGSKPKNGKR